ncbi:MAG TPA: amino acid adenylation domain-containing protein, partial [Pseudonocardiaceae bacterium]
GQSDLVIGAPMAGRDRRVSADQVGLFVNTVPLRVDVSGAPSFGELLGRVRATCLAAYPHQNVPFDEVVRQADVIRSGGRAPLVRVALTLQNVPLTPWQAGEVHAEPFELPAPGAQFELALHLTEQRDGGITGHVSYAADLFGPDTVRRLLDALDLVLRAVPHFPALPVPDLPMITDAERERVVEIFSGAQVPPVADGLLHEPFERQADQNPDAVAVIAPDGTMTYGELEAAANRLARLLLARGVRPDEPVAVCLPRGRHLVVALLAVLKAGAAYLPLDTGYPPARLAAQLRDGRPALVLSTKELSSQLAFETTVLDLDQDPAADFPATRPATVVTPHHLAYVLYTSGTSGIPKGVLNEHAGVSNRIAWMQREYGLVPGEAVLHKTPIGFDVSGWELFWPLSTGATMVLARPGGHQDPAYLARLIREHSVSTCHFVPSMLRVFLEEPTVTGCAGVLRRLVCSGEELPPSVAARCHALLPQTELHNLYGPTEAAIDVTAYQVRPADSKRVRLPIGGPIAGAALYVLDPRGRPTAVGVPGELHIGGIQVARGYLNRPALTAERFVPDPARPGGRLYRTGDRVRWLADGTLEFLGRLDQQVKIRGVRIEPADVAAALAAHPAIVDVVVDARRGPDGEARLVGYPVPAGDDRLTDADLRAFLADRLPSVMVPSAFVWLPVLPVGPSGKLDRHRLPEPAANGTGAGHTAPRNEIERWIAEIWCDVLRLTDISVTADFFDLGGHSLLAARIAARIQAEFDVELSVADLLGGGLTVERLAVSIQQAQLEQVDPEELAAALADVVGDFHDFE